MFTESLVAPRSVIPELALPKFPLEFCSKASSGIQHKDASAAGLIFEKTGFPMKLHYQTQGRLDATSSGMTRGEACV